MLHLDPQNKAATNPNTSRNCARSERREELRYLVGSFNNVSLKVYMTSLPSSTDRATTML